MTVREASQLTRDFSTRSTQRCPSWTGFRLDDSTLLNLFHMEYITVDRRLGPGWARESWSIYSSFQLHKVISFAYHNFLMVLNV